MAVNRHREVTTPLRSGGPLSIWFGRHFNMAGQSLGRLLRQPFASLMIVLVIAVTLALPAALNLIVKNAAAVSGSWDNALDFSVFLSRDISLADAQNLAQLIGQRADVDEVTLITAEQALTEFKQQSGFGDAMDHLRDVIRNIEVASTLAHAGWRRPALGQQYAFSVHLNRVWNPPMNRPSLPWLCCT